MAISLKPLQDQVIVITGASSGIGLVTARMAAQKGAKLVLAAPNEDALRQVVDEIHNNGGQAIYVAADVGQEGDINRIAERAIAEFGGFDTWVNKMFDTNFWGVVYGSRAAVNHFKQRKIGSGALINVGSFFGDRATAV